MTSDNSLSVQVCRWIHIQKKVKMRSHFIKSNKMQVHLNYKENKTGGIAEFQKMFPHRQKK